MAHLLVKASPSAREDRLFSRICHASHSCYLIWPRSKSSRQGSCLNDHNTWQASPRLPQAPARKMGHLLSPLEQLKICPVVQDSLKDRNRGKHIPYSATDGRKFMPFCLSNAGSSTQNWGYEPPELGQKLQKTRRPRRRQQCGDPAAAAAWPSHGCTARVGESLWKLTWA